jgi:UDP-N-acetylmuramyl tripeptide synthase
MAAMAELAASLPARRRLLVIGQAGDRDDGALRALAQSAWALRPDRIVLKEMEVYLRGRPLGEASDVLAAEFVALGAPPDALVRTTSEYDAVREALAWARDGDLLFLPTHAERGRVLGLLDTLEASAWRPGAPLPEA